MQPLVDLFAHGMRPVPYSPPQVFMKYGKNGARYKSAMKDPALVEWQLYVAEYAKEQQGDKPPFLGPVWARLEFTFRHDDPGMHGALCVPEVVWNDVKSEWVKKGASVPDSDNLAKAVFDSLQGIVFGNDVQVCTFVATRRYGPHDAVRANVQAYEDGDTL